MSSINLPESQRVQQRQQFPHLGDKAYFNYGGQGPLATTAIAAIHQAQETIQQLGPFSAQVNAWMVKEAHQTRVAIATELGTTPETIILTENVSIGCNIALWGLDWQPGDHLLLTDCEHQGVIAAAQELQRRWSIEVSVCPIGATLNAGDPVAVIAAHLRPTTRLVVLSHILWNTGQVLPLAAIVATCRAYAAQHTVRILVDAAQSVGTLPLNLTELGVDFYAFTGHKWWCGPAGVGGLYVRPAAMASLSPTFIGWRSVQVDATGQPTAWQPDGRRYEIATSAVPLYAGLRAAIALHQTAAPAADRYRQICARSADLWARLRALPQVNCLKTSPPAAGLVSFQIAGQSPDRIVQQLESQGIFVRSLLAPHCIRACVHYFTLDAEIARLVAAIAAL
jgi:L-cysteine/cystine lyase